MKALSIWQPYASLIAVGAKTIETRHWPPHSGVVGQRIAIHAGKNTRDLDRVIEPRISKALGFDDAADQLPVLPLGAIVATAVLYHAEPMGDDFAEVYRPDDLSFGWCAPGRWAWHLGDVRRLDEPIESRGQQGIYELPAADTARLIALGHGSTP